MNDSIATNKIQIQIELVSNFLGTKSNVNYLISSQKKNIKKRDFKIWYFKILKLLKSEILKYNKK